MTQPRLKGLWSPDLPDGSEPEHPGHCSVLVQADIGTESEGADTFNFTVATRSWLAADSGTIWGRGLLILDRFSWEAVRAAVEKLLAHAARDTWNDIAAELNKELHWEFENYQESP